MLDALREEIKKVANEQKAKSSARFFKTKKGQYGEGDTFVGVTVPVSRDIAKQFRDLPLNEIKELLYSPIHEERLISLIILTLQMKKASEKKKKELVEFYLSHTKQINNWDLVDTSAHKIVGEYLCTHPEEKKILKVLATSSLLWERRIAMVATFAFIYKKEYKEAFEIAQMLLGDTEDLMHKAVGWMLREVGKRCGKEVLVGFLHTHYKSMPRTALRYAIEHFPEEERKAYLLGKVEN